jgi:hypothetical protein
MIVKLEIYKNRMVVTNPERSVTVDSDEPFSTDILLIGNFDAASLCLKNAMKDLELIGLFKPKPEWDIYAKELVSKEISQIEDRIFRELVFSVGSKAVIGVHN